MAIQKFVVTSWTELFTWMTSYITDGGVSTSENTNYFGKIEFTSASHVAIEGYEDAEGTKPIFEFGCLSLSTHLCMKIYKNDTSYCEINGSESYSFYNMVKADIWLSDGGVYIRLIGDESRYALYFIITKTNNGKTAIIAAFSSSTSNTDTIKTALSTNVTSICRGDSTAKNKKITFNIDEQYQTKLSQFTTYPIYGELSYTPNAYYCPVSQFYDLLEGHTISYNGVMYITNGFWAIKDAPQPSFVS